jgi:hypothetical protein
VSYCFGLAQRVQLLILPLNLMFRRVRRIWSGEPGGPPLLEPSLKVEGDAGHMKNSGLVTAVHKASNARGPLKVRRASLAPAGQGLSQGRRASEGGHGQYQGTQGPPRN